MLVDFYNGTDKDSQGRTFDDLIALEDDILESTRDYVPWLFPLLSESKAYKGAPILSPDELSKFRSDEAIRANVKLAVNRYLRFLHGTFKWRNAVDQTHSKISQMLRFLSVIHMPDEANKIADWCVNNGGGKNTHWAWAKCLSSNAPWEKQVEDSLDDIDEQ